MRSTDVSVGLAAQDEERSCARPSGGGAEGSERPANSNVLRFLAEATPSDPASHVADPPHGDLKIDLTPDAEAPRRPVPLWASLGGAPWWIISTILHALAILLIGLVTMAVRGPELPESVIVVTNLTKAPDMKPAELEKKKSDLRDVLDSKHEVQANDADSQATSDIVVPPDILAQAELGDHFETINPDRPDTQSAFGNPDARMFHSVSGNDEPEGGGGLGGAGLSEELIGIGGAVSQGTGGGWGGGNGTGVGIGNGSGKGSFGSRTGGGRRLMVMRHGGTKATESAVDAGLEWLARHQEPDGHWDSAKHGAMALRGSGHDTACTGFALLAFLGAGHTEKIGKYKDHVKRGVEWLVKKQQANGCLASMLESVGYSHAIAGMALAEAAGMGRLPETKAAAQKAINYSVEVHQAGEGSEKRGYRYMPKQEPGDLSNHGWFVMHLKSSKVAGLSIPAGGIEGAIWFLDQVENKNFEKDPQNPYDNGRHRYGYDNPNAVTYRRTAIGCLNRQFMGTPCDELAGGVEWFVRTGGLPGQQGPPGPRGGVQGGGWDLYHWYYGTLCTFQQGGDLWKKWNEALKPTLLNVQRKGGDEDGSWDPKGEFSENWGRVGQTALSIMCLEVYYRYLPMYR